MTDPECLKGTDPEKPTRARFVLVCFLCSLAAILYVDRMCWGQVVKDVQKEFELTNTEVSYVPMAFMLGYGFFAVFIGRLGDRFGSRAVLVSIVVAWSIFTLLTGAASGLIMMIAMQFLFGVSESGTFPNTARVISRWFPLGERGRVQGLLLASAQMGAVVAPFAAAHVLEVHGWRWVFVGFALPAVVWAGAFWWWYRDNPADHTQVNAAELAVIRANAPSPPANPGPVPWRAVFTNRGVIFLSLIMILSAFYSYFFYVWFPKYLFSGRGLDNLETGQAASLVQIGATVGVLSGGWLADRIPRWFVDPVRARRFLGAGCCLLSAMLLFLAAQSDDSMALTVLCATSFCIMQITNPNWWSVIIPQAGKHVGALFGLANGIGGLGAMASMFFVGAFADWQGSRGLTGRDQWDPLFDVYVVVTLLQAAAWWLYRFRPLEE
jgi:ACS family glucarate transporter-like MFS transporter